MKHRPDKSWMRHRTRSLVAAAVASVLAAPTVSWTQTADATLRGNAAANSEVTAKNVATGATRRTKAGADGNYTLVGLTPGTYRVDAGPGTETTVTLTIASTATLDLKTGAAPVVEGTIGEITVSAARLTEVKTSEVGTTVSLQQIQNVPQITRNFLEFADTVPGVVFTVDSSGKTSLRGGAQSANSVNVYIDGIGQKSYVKEGGVSGQFSSQGNPFPQLGIGEYKVITSNYKAEYDQIASSAITASTRSGTNDFETEVFATYTNDSLRAETPAEKAAGRKSDSTDKEYGIAIGGPIIQDRMHFFLTYENKDIALPITVTSGVTGVDGFLPANVAAELGPSDLPFTQHLFFGKLDWEATDNDRLELSAKIRDEDQIQNIGVAQAPSASIDTQNNDQRIDLRWQHDADRWFNDLVLTYEDAFNQPSSRSLGNGFVYTYQPNNDATIIDTGPASAGATQNKGQRGPGIQNDLTFHDIDWHGDHTLKMGVKFKQVKLTAADALNINPQFYFDVNPAGTAADPYKAVFTSAVPGLNPVARSTNKQYGVYFQDDWAVNEKLTLNLGVRWDYEQTPAYLNYKTPDNVIAALNGQDPNAPMGQTYAQSLALGGIDVNDYISTGNNRKAIGDEIQPRLGFSFDLNADQRHVIFGGIGRSYDRDLFDYLQLEETKAALPQFTINFNVPERPCTPSGTCVDWDPAYLDGIENLQALVAASNTGKEVDLINNNLKAPYSDQFSLGMRNRLGDWNTSAAVARILSYDGFAFTLGNRFPDGAFWMNGGQPWGNGVPGFGSLIIGNNGIETKTTQLLLSAERPYTESKGWGVTFAYTYTDAKQNRDINEHYSFDNATIGDYPFIRSNAASKHRLVATGTIKGPWDSLFSAKLTLASPLPVDDIGCYGATFPSGSTCTAISATPDNTLGYRSFDIQATKNFNIAKIASVYLRIDLLNAFNQKNFSDTLRNWGSGGVLNSDPVRYNSIGNITGVPRTVRITIGGKF